MNMLLSLSMDTMLYLYTDILRYIDLKSLFDEQML